MLNRISKTVFIACFISVAITLLSLSSYGEVLFGTEYYETLRKYIAQAEKSIVVAMYFIIMEDESPVNILVDGIITAKNRGVEVKVVLEDAKLGQSLPAFNKLKENGIDVRTDLPGARLHIKGVIIDERYVFLGSANWTKAAIEDNYEATAFTESESDARELLDFIDSVIPEAVVPVEYEGASISVDFLLSPKKGRILLKKQADRQFDIYLLLLKQYSETGKPTFEIDEKAMATRLGYKAPEDIGRYRKEERYYHDMLRNPLNRLEKNGFIEYETRTVTMKEEPPEDQETQPIVIPYEYWTYGYDRALSMRAKYMYLVCLYEAPRSVQYPYWFHSQADMVKLYGISGWTISKGLCELEDIGILEVTRSKPRPPDFSARKANVYKLLPLRPLDKK